MNKIYVFFLKEMISFDLTILSLSIIYFFFSFICLSILFRIITSKSIYILCIPYYILMLIWGIIRGSEFIGFKWFNNNQIKLFYFLIATPDVIFLFSYLFLIWHFLTQYIINHINLANDKNIFKEDVPDIIKKINLILYFIIPIFLIGFLMIIFLYFENIIGYVFLYLIINTFCIITPFILLFFYFFLCCKFSGRPFKDYKSKKEINYILFICIYWSISRFLLGISVLIIVEFFLNKLEDLENLNDFIYIGIIIYFIIIEIIPFYFSVSSELSKTFIKNELNESLLSSNENVDEKLIDDYSKRTTILSNDLESNFSKTKKIKIKNYLIPFKDILLKEELFSKKNGLGKIYKGIYNKEEIVCRIIKFNRLSRYELEEIIKDFEIILKLKNPFISKVIGLCIEQNNIIIISNYYNKGSLFDLLHIRKEKLSNKNKIFIAIGIIKGLQYLHENCIIHYHLSSKNIYIDDDLNPLIADYGFYNLKENASIFNKYINKNSYSSPEILLNSQKISHKYYNENEKKNDIYSFGMLLWEIFTETIPFNVKLSELKKYIIEEKLRPQVSNELNKNIAELIRNCWDSDINKRPCLDKILSVLMTVYENIND